MCCEKPARKECTVRAFNKLMFYKYDMKAVKISTFARASPAECSLSSANITSSFPRSSFSDKSYVFCKYSHEQRRKLCRNEQCDTINFRSGEIITDRKRVKREYIHGCNLESLSHAKCNKLSSEKCVLGAICATHTKINPYLLFAFERASHNAIPRGFVSRS